MSGDAAGLAAPRPHLIRRLYDWTVGWANRPGGTWALFAIAFAESSFFPVPPDDLLIALHDLWTRRLQARSVGSILGGMVGWAIGAGAWHLARPIFIPWVFSQATFDHVQALYRDNAFLAILTAAFTPIPYKVFTVAAGVFDVSILTLVAASMIGRSARFFGVATVLYLFGTQVRTLIERYFDLFTWALLALGIAGFLAIRILR